MDKPELSWTDLELISNTIRRELKISSMSCNAKGIKKLVKILAKIETVVFQRDFPSIKVNCLDKEKIILRTPQVARLIDAADQQTAAEEEEAQKGANHGKEKESQEES